MADATRTKDQIVAQLRKDADELRGDLDKWPEALRGTDEFGGYKAMSRDVELWRDAADLIEKYVP